MFAAALIVFREVLEASLIVTIILAATLGMPHRGKWVSLGIAGGVAGAGLVAAATAWLATLFNGSGQDIADAGILFLAVGLISWHAVWMNTHGRRMAVEMRNVGQSVAEGEKHMSILAIVVGLAVMREGSEIVLMLQGLWTGGNAAPTLIGAGIGLAAGVALGALMYLGFVVLPLQKVFTLTNVVLVLIAAGMAARGANYLVQAGLLEPMGSRLWDSSGFVADDSIAGRMLGALIGYVARPSGVEVGFYVATIATVLMLMHVARARIAVMVAGAVVVAGICLFASQARAGEVVSPYVVKGEYEFEQQGYIAHDRNQDNSGEKSLIAEIGLSPTDFWRTELEGEFAREPGQDTSMQFGSFNWENTFEITEPGEYWIDSGLFAEVDFTRQNAANNFIFGYLGAKRFGRILETANLLLHKDVGSEVTATGLIYSSQTKYMIRPWIEPGFEIYGDTAGKEKFADQDFAAGPGLFGKIPTFDGQALKYEAAYLFGATPATADRAVRWKLEYEFYL
ncbi:MAG: FTR1 family protein [Alphaproteobacteria bacterium]|nr:FTR1 family protein [Alphaproteobacteria bacterium]